MKLKISFKHAPCPTCKGHITGRTDKRFCSIKCKNEHHRNARIQFKSRFHDMQKRLRRNLVVLEGILGPTAKGMNIHKDALFKFGFDIKLCTGSISKQEQNWFELGEYQYSINSNGIVTVERVQRVSSYMPGFFERWEIEFPQGMVVDENWNPMIKQPSQQYFSRWNE